MRFETSFPLILRSAFVALVLIAMIFPRAAHAVCTLPDGIGGDLVYNSDHSVMQYCNDTDWVGMGGPMDALDQRIGTLISGKWCSSDGSSINCTQDDPAGAPAGSVAGAVQFRGSSAVFAADDANLFWDNTNKRLGIGTATPDANAVLDVSSTTQGLLLPRVPAATLTGMTTPANGLIAYDSTNHVIKLRANGAWVSLGSGGGGSGGNTMVSGWPDAIKCIRTADNAVLIWNANFLPTGTTYRYRTIVNNVSDYTMDFNPAGNWTATTIPSNCDNQSIAQLYASGQAYNFVGGASAAADGTVGQVQFNEGGNLKADADLHWDNATKRLGIGTATPAASLSFGAPGAGKDILRVDNENGNPGFVIRRPADNNTTIDWQTGSISQGGTMFLNGPWTSIPKTAAQTPLLVAGTSGQTADIFVVAGHYGGTPRYLTVDSAGRVGVGTADPSTPLEVVGTIKAASGNVWSAMGSATTSRNLLLENFDTTAAANGVDIGAKLGGTEFQGISWAKETAWTSASAAADKDVMLQLGVLNDNTPTNRLFIRANGNVGIGTTSPTAGLDVHNGIHVHGAASYAATGAGIEILKISDSLGTISMVNGPDRTERELRFYGTPLAFYQGAAEKMRVHSNGNVGISTSSPIAKLDIRNAAAQVALRIDNAQSGSGDGLWIQNTGGSGRALALHQKNSSGDILHAYYDGGGGYAIRMALSNAGALWIAGALTQNSDVNMKKDIVEIPDALEKLSRLRGVSYLWKDPQRGTTRQLGLIAQEVELEFPEAVSTQADGTKGVAYTSLIGPLIEAVKELKAANDNLRANLKVAKENLRDELKAANDYQAGEIDDLRREIEALKGSR